MNGLDRILNEISADAQKAAENIIAQAEEEAKRITDRAKEQVAEITGDAEEKAELEYKRIIVRADSSAEVTKNRAMLRAKQDIINDILKTAHERLLGLKTEQYFAYMTGMLDRFAKKGGELVMNDKDKRRATPAFKKAVEKHGLALSEKTRDIDGGFVLVYGEIEENCSFEALMAEGRDRLHDEVNSFLF